MTKAVEYGTLEPELNNIMTYYKFADTFGWTPEQIDRMDCTLVQSLLIVADKRESMSLRERKELKKW